METRQGLENQMSELSATRRSSFSGTTIHINVVVAGAWNRLTWPRMQIGRNAD